MEQQNESFNEGISTYHQQKPDGDVDLIQVVREILLNSGLGQRIAATYDSNRFILEAEGKVVEVQRHLLNRYWTQQLILSGKPTADERYTLIPNGEIKDWIKLFKAKVLPFILENDLPVVLT